MIPDLDIYRSTLVLVNCHERDAPILGRHEGGQVAGGLSVRYADPI